ncbi:Phenylcoumaran benzylic ether reductase 1 [Citrus sinensis]|uniref:Phenylcoumaran benzylic ether reductase 1 n=1 Tax=Citrus sinensis TaxID=2711 RepID=A0ACB8IH11_CITSI|nr:Phenylcoumaran benzylic ether reductase 1 [Citrus sinensis]
MASKSKILSIGGTGYIGKFIVEASVKAGHPTFVLVRESTVSGPSKSQLLDHFKNLGVNFLVGDVLNHESLVKAIKQVDVVISTVGHTLIADQVKIIAAIKEAGNVKPGATAPPRDKVVIFGDGNPKAVFNKEDDIGTYTIKAVDDPRTLNKNFYIQPPGNIYSFNDLVSLWERKIGKTLEKEYVSEEQLLKNIQEAAPPHNVILSIYHSAFVKGVQTNFKIEPSFGVEASQLYPDVKYTTVDEYLNQFV